MQRFWWVNHKKTLRQELEGGYVWSPKREASGARSQFYDNLIRMSPRDGVISYANGVITAIGSVRDFSSSLAKPREFGLNGAAWSSDGWLVPISWSRTKATLRPKDLIASLSPLLPSKYSPLNPETGNGNQKAYLSEVSADVFAIIMERLIETELYKPEFLTYINGPVDQDANELEIKISSDEMLSSTEREQLILARKGQGRFRKNVESIETACRCTGIDYSGLLIASHIKPWAKCASAQERLDGNNGLLLTPHIDFLFDRGLISFNENGDILFSQVLPPNTSGKLGLNAKNVGEFNKNQERYLNYHRKEIFRNVQIYSK